MENKIAVLSVKDAFLESVGCRPLTIIPNCGNAGDSIINHAIFSLAQRCGVNFEFEDPRDLKQISSKRCYLVMVNGGLRSDKPHVFDEVINYLNGNAPMILFSSTITNRDNLIKNLHYSTVIVCRERVTYNYILSIRKDLKVILSEDATMAFSDGDAVLPKSQGFNYFRHKCRCMVKALIARAPLSFAITPKKYHVNFDQGGAYLPALRLDDEKTDIILPEGNVDLSLLLSTRRVDPLGCEIASSYLLDILRSANIVVTNRLHIMIGCCLVGKSCIAYSNNYFKVKAIYDHSLKKRYKDFLVWSGDSI